MRARRRSNRGDERRRYVASYVLSVIVHAVVGAFFTIRALSPSSGFAAETPSGETVAITADRRPIGATLPRVVAPVAVPTPEPRTAVHSGAGAPATAIPPLVRKRIFRSHPVATGNASEHRVTRRPELSKNVIDVARVAARVALVTKAAAPRASAPPSRAPATDAPAASVTPEATGTPEPASPVPTQRSTAPPTAAPTTQPTRIPTVPSTPPAPEPTANPTPEPTQHPTAPPSAAPTTAPSRTPTARPTAAPTEPPTAAPTDLPPPRPATAAPVRATAIPVATAAAKAATEKTRAEGEAAAAAANAASARAANANSAGSGTAGRVADAPSPNPAPTVSDPTTRTSPALVASRPGADRSPTTNPNNGALDRLNGRLNASLPQGTPVTYGSRHFTNTIDEAVDRLRSEYYALAAPPQAVLERVIKVVRQRGSLLDASSSIVYIVKRQRILGIEICTGWKVEIPAPGAKPQGGYTIGSCGGEEFTPPPGLPTPPPK